MLNNRANGGVAATAAPTALVGTGHGLVTTALCTVTAIGGTPPYTYNWIRVGGDPSVFPNTPFASTTTFSATLGPTDFLLSFWHCFVVDATLHGAYTSNISVTMNYSP